MRSRRSSSRFNSQKQQNEQEKTSITTSQLKEKKVFWDPIISLSSYSTSQSSDSDLFSVIDNQISNLNKKQDKEEDDIWPEIVINWL